MDTSSTAPPSGPTAPTASSVRSGLEGQHGPSLGAEVRQSLLLLALSIGVTASVTVAARVTLDLLG